MELTGFDERRVREGNAAHHGACERAKKMDCHQGSQRDGLAQCCVPRARRGALRWTPKKAVKLKKKTAEERREKNDHR